VSRFDRQVHRAKWKRLSAFVRHKVVPMPGTTTRRILIPVMAREPSFHDYLVSIGARSKDFQRTRRGERLDEGLSGTSSNMHRAHGHDLRAEFLRRRPPKTDEKTDDMPSGGGG
jgi:hypothetical protein